MESRSFALAPLDAALPGRQVGQAQKATTSRRTPKRCASSLYSGHPACFNFAMHMNLRRFLTWLSLASLLLPALVAPAAQTVPPSGRILILVSLDAFRWDYMEKYHATNLSRLAPEGA